MAERRATPAEALRPGLRLGSYPERADDLGGGIEAFLARLLARRAARRRSRSQRLDADVAAVRSAGRDLAQERDEAIASRIRELAQALRQRGLEPPLVTRAFALVRELATRQLGTRHRPVQIRAGLVMLDGMLAEMATGEGKTLAATLPAATAALAGIPVHVVTANDYLAARDAKAMAPIYEALGLTVSCVDASLADPAARRAGWACDVAYTTGPQLAFDYLRDGLAAREGVDPRDPRAGRLLRGLCFAIVDEADSVLIDEARTPLVLAREVPAEDEAETARQALALARTLVRGGDFAVDGETRRVTLHASGGDALARAAESLGPVFAGRRRREELVTRALEALHVFRRDRDYLVHEGRIEILDPNTGRRLPDRSWQRGLQALIELKEGCAVSGRRETLARIVYPRFFRRYLRLAGTTGTAREVRRELWRVYGLHVVPIPTHRPCRRNDHGEWLHARAGDKWRAVVARTRALHESGRPVLIGTASVGESEALAARLEASGLEHALLNARQDHREAEIVACAGEAGRITVATRMAGRGTDIRLGPGVALRGGLHVIRTECAEARRIDRQLAGRCARQGEPGSCEAHVSLEDALPAAELPGFLLRGIARVLRAEPRRSRALSALMSFSQSAVERRHERLRERLLARDDQLARTLAFSGRPE